MFFLPPTGLAGYLRRLHFAFWTAIGCMAVWIIAIRLLRDSFTQVGASGLVFLAGLAAFGYYLLLLNHIAFRLKKNSGLWVIGSLMFGPVGLIFCYVRIVSDAKWHMATNVGGRT